MRIAIIVAVIIAVVLIVNGVVRHDRKVELGERLFSGCPSGVDHAATFSAGTFVCHGQRDTAPFGGNGRACGSCHVPGDNFGISVKRIPKLPKDDPFFFPGLDEDQALLRTHGLVRIVDADEDGVNEFRPTPKLVHLQTLCGSDGMCVSLGLLGDREKDLCKFSREAVVNHLAKTTARVEGADFRTPTDRECEALVAFMLSDRVAHAFH